MDVIKLRRELHKIPELAYNEIKTSKYIQNYLANLNIHFDIMAKTGIVANIKGSKSGKTLLLRSDIDALPITEETGAIFASENSGIMHACGHDGHMAILLSVAEYFSKNNDFCGNLKLIFQPAEEGSGGAKPMIDAGVMENPTVDGAFAFHLWPETNSGEISVKYGSCFASPDDFQITIIGKGGHGATPQNCINPIVIASEIVEKLTNLTNYTESTIVTIGYINGGTFENIIPNEVNLGGTARTITKENREQTYNKILKIVNETTEKYGAKNKFNFNFLYPPHINDKNMVDIVVNGEKNRVIIDEKPDMIGEDFAYFAELVPAVMVKLGCTKKGETLTPLHSSNFSIDENCLYTGVDVMKNFVYNYLGKY